jgi:hypothetical protein
VSEFGAGDHIHLARVQHNGRPRGARAAVVFVQVHGQIMITGMGSSGSCGHSMCQHRRPRAAQIRFLIRDRDSKFTAA